MSRRYRHRLALAPIDFDVVRGQVTALVGPNGAGKSTLLAVLAGALPPSSGELARATPPPVVGWLPQRPAEYSHLSARENLELFARLRHVQDRAHEVERLLEASGLAGEERRVSELSVGNRQRLNLAIAMIGDPDLLLLDEPTASLDPEQRARLWQTVRDLRERQGATVFATHYLEEVELLADRVLVLVDGVLAFTGSAAEYAASPGSGALR